MLVVAALQNPPVTELEPAGKVPNTWMFEETDRGELR